VLTLLAKIDRLVGMKSILKALIEISPDLLLMSPDPMQVALLNGYPGINQVLLQESATIEEDVWLSESMHGTVFIVGTLGDVLGAALTIGTQLRWDVEAEARVTIREQHDIVEWSIAVVQMTDPGKTTSMEAKEDVTVEVDMFLTTSRDDGSNLIDSWSIIPAQVCVWIHSDAGLDIVLFLCRLLPEDLMGLLVHLNIRVVLNQHGMEVSHGGWVQVGVPGRPCIGSRVRIKDIELGIGWLNTRDWKESTHLVMKRAMEDECKGPRARKDRVIDISSNGGECKGSIVLSDPFPEFLFWLTTAFE
jgi:hypothetical protein